MSTCLELLWMGDYLVEELGKSQRGMTMGTHWAGYHSAHLHTCVLRKSPYPSSYPCGLLIFQLENPIFFNIENLVLTALKDNQYSGKEDENCNIHLTDFLEACKTINLKGVSKSDKRLTLFGYSLKGRAKD
ncbi:hypothetical protein MTR_8g069230 [Medicago truncatula]|uniref:Uncharacterized protein n=1 Tax=Medicago truncatula TaxID=3880 RepID=G7LJB0_MEDTR|nr:hypothetical protein MTR_8g069230 [Medicago truncatula]